MRLVPLGYDVAIMSSMHEGPKVGKDAKMKMSYMQVQPKMSS